MSFLSYDKAYGAIDKVAAFFQHFAVAFGNKNF